MQVVAQVNQGWQAALGGVSGFVWLRKVLAAFPVDCCPFCSCGLLLAAVACADIDSVLLLLLQASGFPGKMLPGQGSGLIGGAPDAQALADCEITGDCDELAAASAIR